MTVLSLPLVATGDRRVAGMLSKDAARRCSGALEGYGSLDDDWKE